jgi:Tat protein translocase TatB subunit
MFGLSFTHLILLAIIALVVLGPEQLPEVARTIARLLNEWKRATSDIQNSLTNTLRDDFNRPPTPPPSPAPPEPQVVQELPPHAPDMAPPSDSDPSEGDKS